jgi:hypothetical protein
MFSCRDSGVILLASGGASMELLQIWGHWVAGSLGQAYIEKNPLAALQAFAIASGFEPPLSCADTFWAVPW